MANSISELKTRLATSLPDVHFELAEEYGSSASDHRLRLRKALYGIAQEPTLLDLEIVPTLPKDFVSISHCPSLGGFALAKTPVGFDIEVTARVSRSIVERIAHPDDQPAPNDAAMWVAKESIYKSLGKNQPAIISDIAVHFWETADDNIYTFSCPHGSGIVVHWKPWSVAVFRSVSI